jgi:hypothetical protein
MVSKLAINLKAQILHIMRNNSLSSSLTGIRNKVYQKFNRFIHKLILIGMSTNNYGSNPQYAETGGMPKANLGFDDQTIRSAFVRKVFSLVAVMVFYIIPNNIFLHYYSFLWSL